MDIKKAKESLEYFIDNCTNIKLTPFNRELIQRHDRGEPLFIPKPRKAQFILPNKIVPKEEERSDDD